MNIEQKYFVISGADRLYKNCKGLVHVLSAS